MLGRFKPCFIITGLVICNDFRISDSTDGGAEAVRLITGALGALVNFSL